MLQIVRKPGRSFAGIATLKQPIEAVSEELMFLVDSLAMFVGSLSLHGFCVVLGLFTGCCLSVCLVVLLRTLKQTIDKTRNHHGGAPESLGEKGRTPSDAKNTEHSMF